VPGGAKENLENRIQGSWCPAEIQTEHLQNMSKVLSLQQPAPWHFVPYMARDSFVSTASVEMFMAPSIM
jgi:hypothetical protein